MTASATNGRRDHDRRSTHATRAICVSLRSRSTASISAWVSTRPASRSFIASWTTAPFVRATWAVSRETAATSSGASWRRRLRAEDRRTRGFDADAAATAESRANWPTERPRSPAAAHTAGHSARLKRSAIGGGVSSGRDGGLSDMRAPWGWTGEAKLPPPKLDVYIHGLLPVC